MPGYVQRTKPLPQLLALFVALTLTGCYQTPAAPSTPLSLAPLEGSADTTDILDIHFTNQTNSLAGIYTSWSYDAFPWFHGPQGCVAPKAAWASSIEYNHPGWGPQVWIVTNIHKTCDSFSSRGAKIEFPKIDFSNHKALFEVTLSDKELCIKELSATRCKPLSEH
jgi:hypothetical protein